MNLLLRIAGAITAVIGVLLAALIALLCGVASPAQARPQPSAHVHAFFYAADVQGGVLTYTAPERGPPIADVKASTRQRAVDRGSHSRLARSESGTARTYTTPNTGRVAAKGREGPVTTGSNAQAIVADPFVGPACGVATNTERRVFSNLAPGDVPKLSGFHAINPSSLGSASGRYNYVVCTDGRLILGNRRYGHIDLANGGDVLAAGEVRVVNGEVVSINNASGHYKPYGAGAQAAAQEAFGSSGLVVRSGAYSEIVP